MSRTKFPGDNPDPAAMIAEIKAREKRSLLTSNIFIKAASAGMTDDLVERLIDALGKGAVIWKKLPLSPGSLQSQFQILVETRFVPEFRRDTAHLLKIRYEPWVMPDDPA